MFKPWTLKLRVSVTNTHSQSVCNEVLHRHILFVPHPHQFQETWVARGYHICLLLKAMLCACRYSHVMSCCSFLRISKVWLKIQASKKNKSVLGQLRPRSIFKNKELWLLGYKREIIAICSAVTDSSSRNNEIKFNGKMNFTLTQQWYSTNAFRLLSNT